MILQGLGCLPRTLGGQVRAIGANQHDPPALIKVSPRGSGLPYAQVAIPLIKCLRAAGPRGDSVWPEPPPAPRANNRNATAT